MAVVILLLLLGAGAGLVLTGVGKLRTEVPTCYGRPMAPGDTCVAHSTGPVTDGMPTPQDSTYQEQLDSLTSGGWTSIGLGLVLLALGVLIGVTWAAGAGRDRPR